MGYVFSQRDRRQQQQVQRGLGKTRIFVRISDEERKKKRAQSINRLLIACRPSLRSLNQQRVNEWREN
jgi:hypothetical protein